MTKLVLTYFDFDAGRGEAARLAMHITGVAFEDKRVVFQDWPKVKPTMPFLALPVLEVDGRLIAQSNTINRYVGKLAGLYPKDDLQAALCDEAMDATEDISTRIGNTIQMDDAGKKKVRAELAAGAIPRFLKQLEARLTAAGGEFFADRRLTVADLKVFMWVRWLKSGALDHIPADIADQNAPGLVKHFERMSAHPKIAAYYAARKKK